MEKLDVIFKLDPVNDGLVFKKTGIKRKDKGALIIATNGDSRIADPDEAHIPQKSRFNRRDSPSIPLKQKLAVPGILFEGCPVNIDSGIFNIFSISLF